MRATLLGVIAVLVLAATPAAAQEGDGEALYQANCAGCHQAGGVGVPGVFPPLAGNDHVADAEYVRGVIMNGRQGEIEVLGQTYSQIMPATAGLSDAEIDAIVEFVQVDLQAADAPTTDTTAAVDLQAADAPTTDTTAAVDPQAADAPTTDTTAAIDTGEDIIGAALLEASARGGELFAGREQFDNGGPACIACHTAGDLGNLSGPGLGPDLSDAFAALGGGAAVRAALATGGHSDVMAALYVDDPLTDAERADLAAFLEAGAPDAERTGVDGLVVMALGGLLLAVGFAVAIGFGRTREDAA